MIINSNFWSFGTWSSWAWVWVSWEVRQRPSGSVHDQQTVAITAPLPS